MSNERQSQTTDEYNKAAFDFIVDLRGGLPDKCDFCDQPYNEQLYPVPEEAGEWACSECLAIWHDHSSGPQP